MKILRPSECFSARADALRGVIGATPRESPALRWFDSVSESDQLAYWTRGVLVLIGAATLYRLLFVATSDLMDTEAYYASWARFPAWSYYDHAPMTAWLVRAAEWLFGGPGAARLVPVACAAATAWLLFRLGTLLFSPRAGFLAALVTVASPVYFFVGFLVNPEAPLAPMWLLFLFLLYGLRTQREWWRPLVLGAVLGLAFLSKYTGILLLPIALLFVATTPSARGWLRRPSFYLAGGVALAIASPVVIWNALHDWPTLHLHLVDRMSPAAGPALAGRVLHFALNQLLLFHPMLVPLLLVTLGWALWQSRRDDGLRLLALASAVPGVFLAVAMIRARDAEPHWTMVVYLTLAVAAGRWLDLNLSHMNRWLRRYLRVALAASAAFIGLAFVHFQGPQLAATIPGYNGIADPISETRGWKSLRHSLQAHAERLGPGVAVVGSHNVLCGHLLEDLGDSPKVYCVSPARTAYDFLGRGQPPPGVPVLYVDSQKYTLDPAKLLPNRQCHDVERVAIEQGGVRVGQYRIAECSVAQPSGKAPSAPVANTRAVGRRGLLSVVLDAALGSRDKPGP
jgi:hypothetical protein